MAKSAPREGIDEAKLRVGRPGTKSVGMPAVFQALKIAREQMGPVRAARALLAVNQVGGFDCPGCAFPEPGKRSPAEFCENGAKAVAEEATRRRVTPSFFTEYPVAELREKDDFWLGQQGRITHPVLLDAGATHYRRLSWDEAFGVIDEELRGLESPHQAIFYTSGRTSNEAAFAYQLLARGLGTNNLPDCSNMCHESSGHALTATIGIGKGSVSLEDIYHAELILIAGQNPGGNHPRMLTALEKAKQHGATIVAINPLPEAGWQEFHNPQTVHGLLGKGTHLADDYLPIRVGGDQALFQALGKLLLEAEEAAPGTVFDRDFLDTRTAGLADYLEHVRAADWAEISAATGLTQAQIRGLAARLLASRATIVTWAMGLTQHKHAVATLRDIVNVLLLQGNIGRPGAGVCPVRGHSNVQGDRTMGIFEKMPAWFHDALDAEFGFSSPRAPGVDTVGAIRALRDGSARVFVCMGGNFVRAAPDTRATEAAIAGTGLSVQISTKLNRSHAVTGRRALILPTLGRTDRDTQAGGDQRVTVEDSMSMVHASRGRLEPPDGDLLSEVAIVCRLAQRVFAGGSSPFGTPAPAADWAAMERDYAVIRRHIEHVVPGFEEYEARIDRPGGFVLPHPPRDSRTFRTPSGKATFTVNRLEYPKVPPGRLLLQSIRTHDQFNTTIYGKNDRYRGIYHGRRVVLVNADDLTALGLREGSMVDLVSEFSDGVERRAEKFRTVAYPTPAGCAAAYYPETNVLVPLDSVADESGTPTSKSVVVRLEAVR